MAMTRPSDGVLLRGMEREGTPCRKLMGEGLAYGEGDVRAALLVHLSDHAYTHCDDAEPRAGTRTA